MKFYTKLPLLAVVGVGVFFASDAGAAGIVLPAGTTTWTAPQDFSLNGHGDVAANVGISAKGVSATISAGDDVTATDNYMGMIAYNGGGITMTGTGTNTLTVNNNYTTVTGQNDGGAGIQAGTRADSPLTASNAISLGSVTINDMNIVANGNQRGLFATSGGTMKINGVNDSSAPNTLIVKDNNSNGYSGGIIASQAGSTLTITNMNLDVEGFQQYGLQAFQSAVLTVNGFADGSSVMKVLNNANTVGGTTTSIGIDSSGANSIVAINNMNITEGGSIYGLLAESSGTVNIKDTATGILMNFDGNSSYGASAGNPTGATNWGKINVVGDGATTSFSASNNGAGGLYMTANASNAISLTGMGSIILDNNTGSGMAKANLTNASKFTLESQHIEANGNTLNGLTVAANDSVTAGAKGLTASGNGNSGVSISNATGSVTINGGDVNLSQNGKMVITGSGMDITAGKFTVNGDGTNTVTADGNAMNGMNANGATASITVNNANIAADGNTMNGLNAQTGATITATGDGSMNTFSASNNTTGSGLFSNAGTISITNFSTITLNGNTTGSGMSKLSPITGSITLSAIGMSANSNGVYGLDIESGDSVTVGIGGLFAQMNGADGMLVNGATATLAVNGGVVNASANGGNGITVSDGATPTFTGPAPAPGPGITLGGQVTAAGNGQNGIYVTGAGSTLSMSNQTFVADYNTDSGILVDTGATVNVTGKTMTLNNNGAAALAGAGTYNISGAAVSANGNTLFGMTDGGTANLTGSTATMLDDSLLLDASSGASILNAANSTLTGAMATSGGASDVTLDGASVWNMIASSSVTTMNAAGGSVINMGSATPGAFNTLTVANWAADGTATLNMNTDATTSDVLAITNSAGVGNTGINFTVVGPAPSGNNILVVDAAGATAAGANNSTFAMNGGVLDVGPIKYNLVRDAADKNWYLEPVQTPAPPTPGSGPTPPSGPTLTNTAKTIGNLPLLHLAIVNSDMNELRKRLGEIREHNIDKKFVGLWIQPYGQNLNIHENIGTSMNLIGFQAGLDATAKMLMGKVYFGLMGGYLYSGDITVNQDNGRNGRGTATAPSVGAYLTWVHKSGSSNKWFVDLTARNFWVDTRLKNIASNGQYINYAAVRDFVAMSAEVGKLFYFYAPKSWNIGTIQQSHMSMEPKAEIRYLYGMPADTHTNFGDPIHIDRTNALLGRLALQTNYLPNGTQSAWKPFVEIGVYNEFLGKTDATYAGVGVTPFRSRGAGFDLAIGTNWNITETIYAYGSATVEFGQVYNAYLLNLGLRAKF